MNETVGRRHSHDAQARHIRMGAHGCRRMDRLREDPSNHKREEAYLEYKFGDDYLGYKQGGYRWL
jgi:hypothetical protein